MQIGQINNNIKSQLPPPPPPPPKKTPPEVASFMAKLGLSPTNSKEGDDSAIKAKLAELKNPELNAEFQSVISNLKPPAPPKPQEATPVDNFAGMEQLAALNKHFLVNN